MKSAGKINLPTLIRTSLISPLGIFIDLSGNGSLVLVGFNSPNINCWYTKWGSMFILAPKSSKACLITVFPIVHEIVGQPGSLYFTGIEFDRISEIFAARKTFLGTYVALFFVQRSFKNFA